jgi:hypothetical protein
LVSFTPTGYAVAAVRRPLAAGYGNASI